MPVRMIFADAVDPGEGVPQVDVTAVASVEMVEADKVLVSYYRAFPQPDGTDENRVVVRLLWNADFWTSMGNIFERARAMIADQRSGAGSEADARETARRESMALIRAVGGLDREGETIKSRIARTAELLGWDVTRSENIWRGEARRIEAYEMDQLRALARPSKSG